MARKPKLFLDFDGTLAEFIPGIGPDVFCTPGYTLSLSPYKNMVAAINMIIEQDLFDVYIISAIMPYNHIIDDKNAWINVFLKGIPQDHRIYIKYGDSKKERLLNEDLAIGDIFVDDYTKNLLDVNDVNEIEAIKFLNGINDTNKTWKGARVSESTSPEDILITLYGISLANQASVA